MKREPYSLYVANSWVADILLWTTRCRGLHCFTHLMPLGLNTLGRAKGKRWTECVFFFFFFNLFLAVLGLRCCTQAFSSCGEQGLLFVAVRGLLIAVASLVVEHGLQAHGLQQLWHTGSVVVAHGLQSTGSVVVAHELSCFVACGIFPDQGLNPCPLHWQADSQPLCHRGSPGNNS